MASHHSKHLHAALLPGPGLGHLIPIIELGKHLATHHNFTVTIFVATSRQSPAETLVIQSANNPKLCDIVQIPPPDISHLVDDKTTIFTQITIKMREILPTLRLALAAVNPLPTIFIADLFGTEALPLAHEFGMKRFVYIGSNAWFLALTCYLPILDKEVEGEYVDQTEPLKIRGCMALQPEDVVDPMLIRTDRQYVEYVRMGVEIPTGDGILVNTWEDLQGKALEALRDDKLLGGVVKVPVYTIGPLVRARSGPDSGGSTTANELFKWLDEQPRESVIYVSFGSGGTLSYEQMTEVAMGLEMSQQRFVWVVRVPTSKSPDSAFFTTINGSDDPKSYLPEGFLTRTKDIGQVVEAWAPQVDILRHSSTAGFLSHCGWSSTLESLTNGVPMIAWPLYAEQRMNATFLAEELGVAVRPKVLPAKMVVEREEIATMVRKMVAEKEGQTMRERAKQVQRSAQKALAEGGSSVQQLSQFVKQCEVSTPKPQVEAHDTPTHPIP